LLTSLLGLEPDGFNHWLRVVRPMLPDLVDSIELTRMQVGGARVW
jgi:hypothetical protein